MWSDQGYAPVASTVEANSQLDFASNTFFSVFACESFHNGRPAFTDCSQSLQTVYLCSPLPCGIIYIGGEGMEIFLMLMLGVSVAYVIAIDMKMENFDI